jgi:superfamily II DNA or RNA helicase
MTHRDYQDKTIDGVLLQWQQSDSTLAVLPTGTGKTVIIAGIVKRVAPKRTIVVAHREELIFQAKEKIEYWAGIDCDIEKAELVAATSSWNKATVVIASVQTLISGKDKKRMERFKPEDFDYLICDECHRGIAPSYRQIFKHFQQNPNLKIAGFTATPDRADQQALGQVFKTEAFKYKIEEAIEDGWLVRVEQIITRAEVDFSKVRTTEGDLNGTDLAAVMEAEKPLHGVAYAVPQYCGDRKTIVFCCSVFQAEKVCEIINRYKPGSARWVCGETRRDERREMLNDFKNGSLQVVVNVGVLVEGFDNPAVEFIVMGRPTKSRSLFEQMLGRGMRPLNGVVDGVPTASGRRLAIGMSQKQKCIAEGTLILTDVGLIPIEKITSIMKIWDGVEFVSNCGIIFHGEQEIIEYAGLKATADHKVWTQKGWTPFGECATKQIPICITALGRSPVRKADNHYRRDRAELEGASICNGGMHMRPPVFQRFTKRFIEKGRVSDMRTANKISTVALEEVRRSSNEMREQKNPLLQKLWRAWNTIQFYECERYGHVGAGAPWSSQGYDARSNRQQWKLRTWKLEVGKSHYADEQSQYCQFDARGSRVPAGQSGIQNLKTTPNQTFEKRNDVEGYSDQMQASRPIQRKVRVFDVCDCGPRHCFTANGLLVANCTVIDFTGNSGRHKLVTALDILGGKLSPETIKRLKNKAEKTGNPINLELTDEEEEKLQLELERKRLASEGKRANIIAEVRFRTSIIDPFDMLDVQRTKDAPFTNGKTLSPEQRSLLARQGIDASRYSYADGLKLFVAMMKRFKDQKASFKQLDLLKRYSWVLQKKPTDINSNLTRREAGQMLDTIAAKQGWKKRK